MLVSPMQNSGVGGIAQRQSPTPGILRSQWNIGFRLQPAVMNFNVSSYTTTPKVTPKITICLYCTPEIPINLYLLNLGLL